jgi:hypothetical protein
MAMFLRVSFAAWHGLPFFMTAYSPGVGRVHYGHFGQVDDGGRRLSGSPAYGTAYRDYTASHGGLDPAAIETWWPDDTALEARSLTLAEDDRVEFLGADAFAGAYFDEVHLNKRVGHFLIRLLPSFGSIHFADAANLFNLVPGDLREGDVLLHRWQAQGIGHVMVVKEVEALPGGNLDAEIVFGSMPRIQPKWYTAAYSKSYFTSPYSGGPETTSDGTAYSRLGGGIKRWRTPVRDSGRWSNLVPVADRDAWIGSTDWPALEARPETFRGLLGNLSPSEQRDVLVDRIEGARANLRQRPASCANRQRREEAFDELYALMNREWGWSRTRVDETYRHVEDYVYAELEYSQSRTCCWNRTTPEMHGIIAEYTDQLVGTAHEAGECVEPVVFRMRGGGYDPFRAYAHQTGRGGLWAEWSEDEDCPQRANLDDVESNAPWSEFCDVADALLGGDDGGGDDGGGTTGGGSGGSGSGPTCSGCSGQRPVVPWAPLVLGGVLLGRRRRR